MSQCNWFHYPIPTVDYFSHKQVTLMACIDTVTLIKILGNMHCPGMLASQCLPCQ